ncbi:hypothetical protein NKDENANG_02359 [Candidatus Entotheonellaceae bacterium PAL068K]
MPKQIITYPYRIKDSRSSNHLVRMGYAVHDVWNDCNEVSMLAWGRDKHWLSAYDLFCLAKGVSKDLGIHSQTVQAIFEEYVTRGRQGNKRRLWWRSKNRSLGWIPWKVSGIRLRHDTVTYCGYKVRFWLSRPVEGTIKTDSFNQDARGRW